MSYSTGSNRLPETAGSTVNGSKIFQHMLLLSTNATSELIRSAGSVISFDYHNNNSQHDRVSVEEIRRRLREFHVSWSGSDADVMSNNNSFPTGNYEPNFSESYEGSIVKEDENNVRNTTVPHATYAELKQQHIPVVTVSNNENTSFTEERGRQHTFAQQPVNSVAIQSKDRESSVKSNPLNQAVSITLNVDTTAPTSQCETIADSDNASRFSKLFIQTKNSKEDCIELISEDSEDPYDLQYDSTIAFISSESEKNSASYGSDFSSALQISPAVSNETDCYSIKPDPPEKVRNDFFRESWNPTRWNHRSIDPPVYNASKEDAEERSRDDNNSSCSDSVSSPKATTPRLHVQDKCHVEIEGRDDIEQHRSDSDLDMQLQLHFDYASDTDAKMNTQIETENIDDRDIDACHSNERRVRTVTAVENLILDSGKIIPSLQYFGSQPIISDREAVIASCEKQVPTSALLENSRQYEGDFPLKEEDDERMESTINAQHEGKMATETNIPKMFTFDSSNDKHTYAKSDCQHQGQQDLFVLSPSSANQEASSTFQEPFTPISRAAKIVVERKAQLQSRLSVLQLQLEQFQENLRKQKQAFDDTNTASALLDELSQKYDDMIFDFGLGAPVSKSETLNTDSFDDGRSADCDNSFLSKQSDHTITSMSTKCSLDQNMDQIKVTKHPNRQEEQYSEKAEAKEQPEKQEIHNTSLAIDLQLSALQSNEIDEKEAYEEKSTSLTTEIPSSIVQSQSPVVKEASEQVETQQYYSATKLPGVCNAISEKQSNDATDPVSRRSNTLTIIVDELCGDGKQEGALEAFAHVPLSPLTEMESQTKVTKGVETTRIQPNLPQRDLYHSPQMRRNRYSPKLDVFEREKPPTSKTAKSPFSLTPFSRFRTRSFSPSANQISTPSNAVQEEDKSKSTVAAKSTKRVHQIYLSRGIAFQRSLTKIPTESATKVCFGESKDDAETELHCDSGNGIESFSRDSLFHHFPTEDSKTNSIEEHADAISSVSGPTIPPNSFDRFDSFDPDMASLLNVNSESWETITTLANDQNNKKGHEGFGTGLFIPNPEPSQNDANSIVDNSKDCNSLQMADPEETSSANSISASNFLPKITECNTASREMVCPQSETAQECKTNKTVQTVDQSIEKGSISVSPAIDQVVTSPTSRLSLRLRYRLTKRNQLLSRFQKPSTPKLGYHDTIQSTTTKENGDSSSCKLADKGESIFHPNERQDDSASTNVDDPDIRLTDTSNVPVVSNCIMSCPPLPEQSMKSKSTDEKSSRQVRIDDFQTSKTTNPKSDANAVFGNKESNTSEPVIPNLAAVSSSSTKTCSGSPNSGGIRYKFPPIGETGSKCAFLNKIRSPSQQDMQKSSPQRILHADTTQKSQVSESGKKAEDEKRKEIFVPAVRVYQKSQDLQETTENEIRGRFQELNMLWNEARNIQAFLDSYDDSYSTRLVSNGIVATIGVSMSKSHSHSNFNVHSSVVIHGKDTVSSVLRRLFNENGEQVPRYHRFPENISLVSETSAIVFGYYAIEVNNGPKQLGVFTIHIRKGVNPKTEWKIESEHTSVTTWK